MRHVSRLAPLVLAAGLLGCGDDDGERIIITEQPPYTVALLPVATGLAAPVYLTAPAGDSRLFVVERAGRVRVIVNDAQVRPTSFIDVSARVSTSGERGLLSIAFDPAFASNGHVFVHFTDPTGAIVVERWTAERGADVASPASAIEVIRIPHPRYDNHNGGLVMFGPDGMLYLSTGDGGGGGDPDRNAQDLNSLLGKILRLDVRALPYAIPAGNPFAGRADRRPEIWAWGLRNPWRFDFADSTGTTPALLYVADVGQNAWEEVNVVRADSAGVNYGWNVAEGAHCFVSACSLAGLLPPAIEYGHAEGCSVIGGFVARGVMTPRAGAYFYSDFCSGWVETLTRSAAGWARLQWAARDVGQVLGFGEGADGQQYLLAADGSVNRMVATVRSTAPPP